jgi:hypothetical protein
VKSRNIFTALAAVTLLAACTQETEVAGPADVPPAEAPPAPDVDINIPPAAPDVNLNVTPPAEPPPADAPAPPAQ